MTVCRTVPSRIEPRVRAVRRQPRLIGALVGGGALVGLAACGAAATRGCAETRKAKPICVVLSVGGENGLAHIGVLEAMKSRGIQPECVFGNSMGALVGGLYAAHPGHDIRHDYRSLMEGYAKQTKLDKDESSGKAFLFFLLGGANFGEAMVGGLGVSSLVYEQDHVRFVKVLDRQLAGMTIEQLPLRFGTWHEALEATPTMVTVTSGNLAEAIGRSAANPVLFRDVQVQPGARFDPGADRVAAVPLDDACRLRPDAHFLVSNVTGQPLYLSTSMKCSYDEIRIQPPKIDARSALTGIGADFDNIVSAGFAAANEALRGKVPERADFASKGTR